MGKPRIRFIFFLLFALQVAFVSGKEYDKVNTPLPNPDSLCFHLPDVVITAIESRAPGTASLLPASTIEHIQPMSVADLMQLLPGGLTGNSNYNAPQYFTVREIAFHNGGNHTASSVAEGMQIVLDGSPLHHNTDIGSPYSGMDTRFLSVNDLEQAEVVRGIPSVQYGNLTNGLLKLKTRNGEMPLSVSIRYNPSLKQYTAGKGFRISPYGHTLNLIADYTSQETFHTGGLRLANNFHWQPGGTTLNLNLAYSGRIGGEKIIINDNNYERRQRQEHRFTLGSEWKPERKWLETVSLRIDLSAVRSKLDEYGANNTQRQVATEIETSGEWQAKVINGSYYYNKLTEGLPLYAEAEVIAATLRPLPLPNSRVELKAGLSWRTEGNHGKGVQFDPQHPPTTSIRPRSYKETPFLHNTAIFAEALFRIPHFTLQAGIRYTGLKSRDYDFIGNVEPRANLNWIVFSSPRYQLALRAGAGLMGYMPTIDRLYPGAIYRDRTSFYYNDTENNYSLALVTVHAPGEIKNKELRPTVNRKLEGGFMLLSPAIRLDMTAFFERQTGGFGAVTDYLSFVAKQYEYLSAAGLRPEYHNGQVFLNGDPLPYKEVTNFTTITQNVNTTITSKQGVEITADFGTFQPLRTSFVVDSRWLRIRRSSSALTAYLSNNEVNGAPNPVIGYYDKNYSSTGNGEVSEQLSSNFRFITRIPNIGLVTTLTLQMIWIYKYQTLYNGGTENNVWPLYWSGADGIRHPFTEAEKGNPDFRNMLSSVSEDWFEQDSYKPYGLLNLRVSKEFTRFVTLSFFANNLADMRPSRYTNSSQMYIQQNPASFYGLEIQIKL